MPNRKVNRTRKVNNTRKVNRTRKVVRTNKKVNRSRKVSGRSRKMSGGGRKTPKSQPRLPPSRTTVSRAAGRRLTGVRGLNRRYAIRGTQSGRQPGTQPTRMTPVFSRAELRGIIAAQEKNIASAGVVRAKRVAQLLSNNRGGLQTARQARILSEMQ